MQAGWRMVVVPAAVEGAALATALLPFIVHRWDMYRWDRDHRGEHRPKGTQRREELTVLLPVWNEVKIIEKKLDNLASQNVSARLVIIDSASTDGTVQRARDWLQAHPSAFESFELLEMDQRKGKTAAVIQALQHIGQHHEGLICMTDADAMLERGVLHRLMQWFADPMIGAVGALPSRINARTEEAEHRASWDAMRLAEAMVDSTPFLEGSCMMWRPSSMAIDDLVAGANADDAQIATSVRCMGWRVVVDASTRFVRGPRHGFRTTAAEDSTCPRSAAIAATPAKASRWKTSGCFCTNLPSPIPLPHHRSSGVDGGHRKRCASLGVHRPVRLAGHVHVGQQPSSWFLVARGHVPCAVVAKSSWETKRSALPTGSMADQHGIARSCAHHHGSWAFAPHVGSAQRRARPHDVV